MKNDPPATRDRLIQTAAMLFRQKGYHGAGLAEILAVAKAPKGSLYHHFPNGKPDLAMASADWASAGMLQIIEDSFGPANDYASGAATLCHKLAKFFDISNGWDGCPVSHVLFDGPDNEVFRRKANSIYDTWVGAIAAQAIRLGQPSANALHTAETLLIGIQGSWVLARARQNSDTIRQLPSRILS